GPVAPATAARFAAAPFATHDHCRNGLGRLRVWSGLRCDPAIAADRSRVVRGTCGSGGETGSRAKEDRTASRRPLCQGPRDWWPVGAIAAGRISRPPDFKTTSLGGLCGALDDHPARDDVGAVRRRESDTTVPWWFRRAHAACGNLL